MDPAARDTRHVSGELNLRRALIYTAATNRRRNHVRSRLATLFVATAVVLVACGSGPSAEVVAADRRPATTTTTEPPPEGVVFVRINNGAFRPSNLEIDPAVTPVVRWVHEDTPERLYELVARGDEFMSPLLGPGDVFEVDFSEFDPGIYRYFAFLGRNRIPGTVDTRPNQ